jgi:thioredoxin reductase (NADPH)
MSVRDLIIVGAGPSGLSAGIAAKRHGLDYQILEQGVLVNSIYRFPPQMVFFTTPELLEIGGLPFITPYDKPTRPEALRYYRRVTETFDLQVAFSETVLAITPEIEEAREMGVPSLFTVETRSSRGVRRVRQSRNVLLAIGYYDHPNMLGIPGEDLAHVYHYYGEPHPFYRQRVVIVGGGNSAAESALEMHRAGAHVTIVHRHAELKPSIKYWVRPDIENRIKEGSIAARFNTCVKEIRPTSVVVTAAGSSRGATTPEPDARGRESTLEPDTRGRESTLEPEVQKEDAELPADAVFLLVGYHSDWDLMANAGIELNERRAPRLDPETFETNVPGLFVAGGAVAGMDTGNIFIENGRFHGEKIVEVVVRRARTTS